MSPASPWPSRRALLILLVSLLLPPSSSAVDFLFNSFGTAVNATDDLILIEDARVDGTVLRLTNHSNQFSFGRVFYPRKLTMIPDPARDPTRLSSFSTSFVFSILPDIDTSLGFGLCIVLSNSTSRALACSQYFGPFINAVRSVAPHLVVEFNTGWNGSFIGIDLNYHQPIRGNAAGYYDSANGSLVPVDMR